MKYFWFTRQYAVYRGLVRTAEPVANVSSFFGGNASSNFYSKTNQMHQRLKFILLE